MTRIAALCLTLTVLATAVLAGHEASAFSRVPRVISLEETELSGGRKAQMLLVYLATHNDPVVALIVDSTNQIIAKSRHSRAMALVCQSPAPCIAYDAEAGEILEPDTKALRPSLILNRDGGGQIILDSLFDAREVWDQNWGFISREPTLLEWLRAQLTLAAHDSAAVSLALAAGILVGLTGVMILSKLPPRGRRGRPYLIGLKIATPVLLLPIAAFMILLAKMLAFVATLFLFSFFLAGVIFISLFKLVPAIRQLRSHPIAELRIP